MSLVDVRERELATIPSKSFIVQAPAGSGKTEVLTQRYLRLLSTVNKPEEIISITFTKKAASEMRERILRALLTAKENSHPSVPHQLSTYNYACQALKQSQKLNWNILEQPNRLRIITIDSLSQMLTNAIYIQGSKTAFAEICTNPEEIYQQTASECLNYAATDKDYQPYLITLLNHLDNRQDIVQKLLAELLATRDVWLEELFTAKYQDKTEFARGLKFLEEKALSNFSTSVNKELSTKLLTIIKQLYTILRQEDKELFWIKDISALNTKSAGELCALLLTSSNKLRKSFDHHVGLKKEICSEFQYQQIKSTSKELLSELAKNPSFLDALLQIKDLPDPEYSSQQWQILEALFVILPLLVAHLELKFQETSQIDFTGITNESLRALGDELEPTNLALYLDNKIQHILIDEFQDTSLKQFQLINRLVQGWQDGDGRTLFVVGDPQQSIYRFRGAEVGLFLKAKLYGIANNISMTVLSLTCNFRSSPTIVNWVNQTFKNIFPYNDDISAGAISYSDSFATQTSNAKSFIQAHDFDDPNQEAEFIVATILHEQKINPNASIAILVRSRKQLNTIMRAIRSKNIPYQGVDVELLAKKQHIRDVYSFTKTLFMPGNRLAWLTFLRSIFCGLSLSDILIISEFAPKKSIYFALNNLDEMPDLSTEGYTRAKYIFRVLNKAIQNRAQCNSIDWLINTLNELHINSILEPQQILDLEQYWQLVDEHLIAGDIANWQLFTEKLNNLYSKQTTFANLQIMTIHKSKGLEFDCVIVPGLGDKSPNQDTSLFRTLNLPDVKDQDILLFSPIKAASADACNLYNYIKKIDEQKSNYELQRLLYVAATRAKQRLYLTNSQINFRKNSFRSFLNAIEFTKVDESQKKEQQIASILPDLTRLPLKFYQQLSDNKIESINQLQFTITDDNARIQGIVTHEILQWICENRLTAAYEVPEEFIQNLLFQRGICDTELQQMLQEIQTQINNLFQDQIGRWIIFPHQAAKSEYEVLINNQGIYKTKILDRIFIEDNNLWIIDFKTGKDDVSSKKANIQQVEEYADLIDTTQQNIKCGLYYLTNNHWHTWDYQKSE